MFNNLKTAHGWAKPGELWPLLFALSGVIVTLLAVFALNPSFFFIDDRLSQYFPYGIAIRDALLQGKFPFVTTRTFYGGALWLDWQYGIYNPLSLLLTLTITTKHLGLSGLIFALVMTPLVTTAAYILARRYGIRPPFAALAGLLLGLNPYLLYIASCDWGPAIASLPWFLLAWAEIKRLLEGTERPAWPVLRIAVFVYLMFTAGWPHTDVAFAIIGSALFIDAVGRRNPRAVYAAASAVLGAIFCAPALVPVLASFVWTFRSLGVQDYALTPTLSDMLNFSNPAWWPKMSIWPPRHTDPIPLFYLGWFILPALFFLRWEKVDGKEYRTLGIVLTLFIVLATGGAPLPFLNFPCRWAIFAQTCLLLILFPLLQDARLVLMTRQRVCLALAALAASALAALAGHPTGIAPSLLLLPSVFAALLLYPRLQKNACTYFGITSVILAIAIAQAYPYSTYANHWKKQDTTVDAQPQAQDKVDYTLYSGWPRTYDRLPPVPGDLREEADFPTSALGIYYGVDTINGYSSIGHRHFNDTVGCLTGFGPLCTVLPVAPLMRREPQTGQTYLTLLKITKVVTEKNNLVKETAAALPRNWTRREHGSVLWFEKPGGSGLPGTASWASPSVTLAGPASVDGNEESFHVASGATGGRIAFARLFYPGFRASLDGAELPVRPVSDLLVGVDIPPQASGTFRLVFRPAFFGACVLDALLGLLIWGVFAIRERRR